MLLNKTDLYGKGCGKNRPGEYRNSRAGMLVGGIWREHSSGTTLLKRPHTQMHRPLYYTVVRSGFPHTHIHTLCRGVPFIDFSRKNIQNQSHDVEPTLSSPHRFPSSSSTSCEALKAVFNEVYFQTNAVFTRSCEG